MKGVKEMVTVRSSDIDPWLECQLYCEDKRLSLPGPGRAFKTISLKGRKDIPMFNEEQLERFLDMCVSFMNVDMTTPLQPAAKASMRRVLESPVYKETRGRLMAICDQVLPYQMKSAYADDNWEEA